MKTVESRIEDVMEAAIAPIDRQRLRAEIAKHLTQQAAEWQIALKEAVEAETLRGQQVLKDSLAASSMTIRQAVEMERKNWEAYREGEAARISKAVAENDYKWKVCTGEPERPASLEELAVRLINRFEEVFIEEGMKAILCYKPVDNKPAKG